MCQWINECVNEWMNVSMNELMCQWINECVNEWMNVSMNVTSIFKSMCRLG
jgi:hypothetical protein